MQKYDLIGDIHGYATTLKALLTKLGYRVEDGAYRHPERMVNRQAERRSTAKR